MYFDRFDILEAHFLFCSLFHDGQWSDLYARLSRILGRMGFYPRPSLNSANDLTENGQVIFRNLENAWLEELKAFRY